MIKLMIIIISLKLSFMYSITRPAPGIFSNCCALTAFSYFPPGVWLCSYSYYNYAILLCLFDVHCVCMILMISFCYYFVVMLGSSRTAAPWRPSRTSLQAATRTANITTATTTTATSNSKPSTTTTTTTTTTCRLEGVRTISKWTSAEKPLPWSGRAHSVLLHNNHNTTTTTTTTNNDNNHHTTCTAAPWRPSRTCLLRYLMYITVCYVSF